LLDLSPADLGVSRWSDLEWRSAQDMREIETSAGKIAARGEAIRLLGASETPAATTLLLDLLDQPPEEFRRVMIADYDNRNPEAMKKLIGGGAKLSYFPKAVMEAAYKASNEVNDSLAEANPEFKAILPGWIKYRRDQASWFRVVEAELDNFTFTNVTK
jgi:hypothetical protein